MIRPRVLILTFGLIYLTINLHAQKEVGNKNWQVRGYVKDLLTVNVANDSTLIDNLIHHRLNLKWYLNDQLTTNLEIRTRLFTGDLVKAIPNYNQFIDVNNDFFDLSTSLQTSSRSVLLHSMIDRAYLEWVKNNWEVRLGRQRVNWGINMVWNPNDLFNAYSFFDFDYEERPGSDAIRVTRYLGVASSVELAANVADSFDDMVLAGLWRTNRWNYDFQLLAGKARQDLVIGGGWAGNIGDAGFKGELTLFHPYENTSQLNSAMLISFGLDYSFENSLYFNLSGLLNTDPSNPDLAMLELANNEPLTARTLSPFRYSTFLQTSYQPHPLISTGIATIYYPGERNALFINPTITFSLYPNLDLDLISQLYFDESADQYRAQARLFFFRIKWSY